MIQSFGFAVFANGGLLACIAIFGMQWARGEELNMGESVSLLAMVFYIFLSINQMTYMAMVSLQTFMAIIYRISTIFEMEEYQFIRNDSVKKEDVTVSFEEASLTWGFKVKQDSAGKKDKKDDEEEKKKLEEQIMQSSKYKIARKADVKDAQRLKIETVTTPTLSDLNFTMKSGDFMVVIGQVGCGKTSLLYSIMHEMEVMKGKLNVAGSISYVEQEPFIYSASIKDNILFGNPYDKERLNDAIKYSQMTRDIELFGKGVDTVIGERGTNISGG